MQGQAFEVSILRIYLVLSAEFGGKGDRCETVKYFVTDAWHRRYDTLGFYKSVVKKQR
jgi:hypothetical protein